MTWYGDDGERVELSGAVLENWVNKTTNLLVDEFDAGPGTHVVLDLPPHWRSLVWALAVWRCGACVVARRSAGDIVVTDAPERHPGADPLVVVALPALARRYAGDVPRGAVDASSAVMTYADALGYAPRTDPAAPALVTESRVTDHGELLPVSDVAPERTLLGTGGDDGLATFLLGALGVLAAGGSVVLLSDSTARELRADPQRLDRLTAGERVTARR